MKSLFAIVFDDKARADAALEEIKSMQQGAVLTLHDAVFVSRTADGGVRLDQSVSTAAIGALSGAFWGSLIGLIFLAPLLGAAVGAAAGGVSGYLTDYGISDDFAQKMGNRLAPGRVALFILASDVSPERVASALEPHRGELFYSSFSPETEDRFRQGIRGDAATAGSGPSVLASPVAPPGSPEQAAETRTAPQDRALQERPPQERPPGAPQGSSANPSPQGFGA